MVTNTNRASGNHHGEQQPQQTDAEVPLLRSPIENLNYYRKYNTITQNSAGSINFECVENWAHIYVSSSTYSVNLLENRGATLYTDYIGSLAM